VLSKAWDSFIEQYEVANQDFSEFSASEQFLVNYPEPNWVIYKITSHGMACGPVSTTVWHVVHMNVVK
jgi:hypothetical protein